MADLELLMYDSEFLLYDYAGDFILYAGETSFQCCCLIPEPCDCDALTDIVNCRLTYADVNCGPSPDPAICVIAEQDDLVLTESVPVPEGLGVCGEDVRHFSGYTTLSCISPAVLIEFVCCKATITAEYWYRIDGQAWTQLQYDGVHSTGDSPTGCACAYYDPYGAHGAPAITTCCGAPWIQFWFEDCPEPTVDGCD